jgi:hypothetical protein
MPERDRTLPNDEAEHDPQRFGRGAHLHLVSMVRVPASSTTQA